MRWAKIGSAAFSRSRTRLRPDYAMQYIAPKSLLYRSISARHISARLSDGLPVTGLSVRDLKTINLPDTQSGKVRSAADHSHFALATLIALKTPEISLDLDTQVKLIRGLIQYHPRLTPINLQALQWLHKRLQFSLESVDKSMLVQTLVEYGDHQLIRSAIDFLERTEGGPIPNSALMALVRFSKDRNAVESCNRLWDYVRHKYPLELDEYTALMMDLMEVFARSHMHGSLAAEVARACLGNVSNHSIALSIAKVCYKLGDRELTREFLAAPGLEVSRGIKATMLQLEVKLASKVKDRAAATSRDLTAQEFSGIVKAVAEKSLESAEDLLQSLEEPEATESMGKQQTNSLDELGKPKKRHAFHESQKALLAQVALCNQYAHNGALAEFVAALDVIYNTAGSRGVSGIVLNLKLKWELLHGSFKHAKRHYQNFSDIPVKQRIVALNTLSTLASDDTDRLWVSTERRRLERYAKS